MDQTALVAELAYQVLHVCQHFQIGAEADESVWPLIHTTPDGRTCLSVVGSELLLLEPDNVVSEGACKRQIEAGTYPMGYIKESEE